MTREYTLIDLDGNVVEHHTADSDGIAADMMGMYPYEEDKALRTAEITSLWAVVAVSVAFVVLVAVAVVVML